MAGTSSKTYACPYCPKGFTTAGAFSKHRRQCTHRTQAFADSYNKRKAENEEAEEAKRARLEQEDAETYGDDPMVCRCSICCSEHL